MEVARSFMTILVIGAVGAVIYTLVTNGPGVTALFNGVDHLYQTAEAGALGRVA